ncbi:hypothetical protein [Neolewinella persica]|uniref:hypothetical protein n=1 Tax=Neolewinella persica TaxID=70998 RepID=UPI000370F918|nr:hypothetical protein [Neolewinella persica]
MNDRKELISLLEYKFQRLASQRKAALDLPDELGEGILEALEEVEDNDDLTLNHGEDVTLPSGFIDFMNESSAEPPVQKNKK